MSKSDVDRQADRSNKNHREAEWYISTIFLYDGFCACAFTNPHKCSKTNHHGCIALIYRRDCSTVTPTQPTYTQCDNWQ